MKRRTLQYNMRYWQLFAMLLVPVVHTVIFQYIPIVGNLLAFKNYKVSLGILDSPWVGFKYFGQFFQSPYLWDLIRNTVVLSSYSLLASFPIPIVLAVAINEVKNRYVKKSVQTITFFPYFISTVVIIGILSQFFGLHYSVVNNLLGLFGREAVNFMGEARFFRHLYVWSGVWQSAGYSSVLYIAALTSVDPSLHESAIIDGANRLQRILRIDLPTISPTIIIMLILSFGGIMNVGFEKTILMQNSLNLSVSEVISTYVYKVGILDTQYGFSTAVGLFNSVINMLMLLIVNFIARRISQTSLL